LGGFEKAYQEKARTLAGGTAAKAAARLKRVRKGPKNFVLNSEHVEQHEAKTFSLLAVMFGVPAEQTRGMQATGTFLCAHAKTPHGVARSMQSRNVAAIVGSGISHKRG
jgi:hypothetical protein